INFTTRISNLDAIKYFTLHGMGISLLPNWLARDEITDGKLIKLFSNYDVTATDYDSSIWLVYPSREYLAKKSRVFIDLLTKKFN
ncbi:MAG: LysR substrate-binding domain-containing protein, partial [Thiohalomonadales bacterium]